MFTKKTTKSCLCFLTGGILDLVLKVFDTPTKSKKQPLVVERQSYALQHMVGDIPSEDFDIGIIIDVHVDGNSILVDSVMRLLNQAIYNSRMPRSC